MAQGAELFLLPVDLMQLFHPILLLSQELLLLNLVKALSDQGIQAQVIGCYWH